jgi:hypothetical protein
MNNIATMSDDELFKRLKRLLQVTRESIAEMAALIYEYEKAGKDMELVKEIVPPGLLRTLRRIGGGQMLAEVYMNFEGCVQGKIAAIPLVDQKHLINGGTVKLMLAGGDHLLVSPAKMEPEQVRQVFANGHIRDDSEQINWLLSHAKPAEPVEIHEVAMVNRKKGTLVVTEPVELTRKQLLRFLDEME